MRASPSVQAATSYPSLSLQRRTTNSHLAEDRLLRTPNTAFSTEVDVEVVAEEEGLLSVPVLDRLFCFDSPAGGAEVVEEVVDEVVEEVVLLSEGAVGMRTTTERTIEYLLLLFLSLSVLMSAL
jgi:hypothetical protein